MSSMVGGYQVDAVPGDRLVYVMRIEIPAVLASDLIATVDLGTIGGRTISGFREFHTTVPPAAPTSSFRNFSTEDWTSLPTDTLIPNTWFDGRMTNPGTVSRSFGLAPVDNPGLDNAVGNMTMNNEDGGLDAIPDESLIVNAPARIWVGVQGADLGDFDIVTTGFVRQIDVGLTSATMELAGTDALDETMYFDAVYAGTGDEEGPVGLTGTRKPFVLGRIYNMAPVMIEPNTYLYQAHTGVISAVTAVRFGGVEFTFDADYATFALLEAATVATGDYSTCLAEGLIKPGITQGGAEAYTLTCDIDTALTEAAAIAEAVVIELDTLGLGLGYDAAAFTAIKAALTGYNYGRVITEPLTYREVLDDLFYNLNAYWGTNRLGEVSCGWMETPLEVGTLSYTYTDADIYDIDRLGLPSGFEWPHKTRTVRYAKNWSVQTSLAAIVLNPSFGEEYKEYTGEQVLETRVALAPEPRDLNLTDLTGATALVDRLLDQHGVVRRMYSCTVSIFSGVPGLGQKINLVYPRFGLNGGRELIVVAATENYQLATVQLTLWG